MSAMWVTKLETIQYSVGKAALGDLKDGYKKKRKVKKSKKSPIGAAEDALLLRTPVLKKGRMLQLKKKGRAENVTPLCTFCRLSFSYVVN
jgi:hypothetical protein